jgi:tRNA(Ile)-lysidine synthase
MSAIETTVQATVRQALALALPGGGQLLVAVSGGADSLCLLHALCALALELGLALHVAHLDHGLRAASAADAAWVGALCADWELPCTLGHCEVRVLAERGRLSLEDAARQARYSFLARVARQVGARAVAVGHTADDQAETVLLHLLRGAGLEGLAGMAPDARWPLPDERGADRLRLLRPLLTLTRAETEAYCAAAGLLPRQDESNRDPAYTRNRVRLELLPLLRELNPGITATLGRTAQVIAGEVAALQSIELKVWAAMAAEESGGVRLARTVFEQQAVGLQRRLLRRAVAVLASLHDLTWEQVEAARRIALAGRTGACASLPHGLRLRVGYGWLWIEPAQLAADRDWPTLAQPMQLHIPGEATLAAGWRLTAQQLARAELPDDWATTREPWVAYLDADAVGCDVLLRARRPGDWLVPLGLGGRQKLSDLLINVKMPAVCREALPLVLVGEAIAWVVGVRCDQRFAVTDHTERVCVLRVARDVEG